MPSYPPESIVHQITNHSCAFRECPNSKLKGASMKLCQACKMVHYCSRECQRGDWARHKPQCKLQAESLAEAATRYGTLVADSDRWQSAMTPILFTWICSYGLEVMSQPTNMATKLAVLSIRKRDPPPSNARKLFTFENVEIYERGDAVRSLKVNFFLPQLQEADERAKGKGHLGAAGLFICVKTAEGGLATIRCNAVIVSRDALNLEPCPGWKELVKNIIDDGTDLRRRLAEKERSGELEGQVYMNIH